MNKMMKDFINHLFDIGILGVNSIKLFLNFYDKQKQSTFKVRELLAKILYDYFANLDNNGLENLCFEIISKFAESKSLDTTKVTKKLLNLYFKNQNNHLISCFYLWKKESIKGKILTRNNNSNLLKFGKTQSISKKFLNSFQNMYNGTLSSREIKEENEFRDCTFKPKINENYEFKSSNRNTLDTFDRLYSDYEKLQIKKISNKIELEEKENKKMTFSPSILTRDKSFKNTSRDPFLNRQEQYLKNLSEKKTITFKTSDEEKLENECTFSPKIYSKILIDQPASYRLYQDNTKRLKNLKALHKIRELGEKMRSLSSDKNNYCSINIEEMYSNYKNKTHKITELREKQDKEQGLTFNPRFYKNPNIKISSSFLERNYLNKKKTFEKDKSYITTPKVKTVSNREYEEIEKGIIERLYTKEIEKITERNKSEDKEKINNISSTKFNNKSKLDKSILSNSKKDNKTNTVKNDRTRKNNINT